MSVVQNTNVVSVLCLFPIWDTLLTLVMRSLAAWEPFFQDGSCGCYLQSYRYITNYLFHCSQRAAFFGTYISVSLSVEGV